MIPCGFSTESPWFLRIGPGFDSISNPRRPPHKGSARGLGTQAGEAAGRIGCSWDFQWLNWILWDFMDFNGIFLWDFTGFHGDFPVINGDWRVFMVIYQGLTYQAKVKRWKFRPWISPKLIRRWIFLVWISKNPMHLETWGACHYNNNGYMGLELKLRLVCPCCRFACAGHLQTAWLGVVSWKAQTSRIQTDAEASDVPCHVPSRNGDPSGFHMAVGGSQRTNQKPELSCSQISLLVDVGG